MLKLILNRSLSLYYFSVYNVQKFERKDYETMCSLIKQKFPVYNESIEINKDIKLVDQNNKLIGRYTASQARKKAVTLKKDIILVNSNSNPAVCKVTNFRESILTKFLDEIVNKRNQQLISKASTTKQLKISTNLSANERQIKSKQITELAKKNLNVRVYSICKPNQKDEGLVLFDYIKSTIQNKCVIEKEIKFEEYQQKDEDGLLMRKEQNKERVVISMVVKAKTNEFMELLQQTSNKNPQQAISLFLNRYYKQQDVDMKDLKQTEQRTQEIQLMTSTIINQKSKLNKQKNKSSKQSQMILQTQKSEWEIEKQRQIYEKQNSYVQREAKARILNLRLKRILGIQNQ